MPTSFKLQEKSQVLFLGGLFFAMRGAFGEKGNSHLYIGIVFLFFGKKKDASRVFWKKGNIFVPKKKASKYAIPERMAYLEAFLN